MKEKNKKQKLIERLKKVPRYIWILAIIFILGIFLRTYHLHAWLDFGSDQVNDAMRVGEVVDGKASWPLLGPDMSNSGNGTREERYRLGPIFYYFEIISAKIFGNYPDKLAYPDTLFSILSLPLFYLFFRRYFDRNMSMALTGLYAVSFYALKFSHSAWNPNSIPFWTVLFLISCHEFLMKREKISWWWVFFLGLSIGVGIQLHAILLVLLPAVSFFVFIYLLKTDWRIVKKMAAVILIVIAINGGHIISEYKNGLNNTKTFFSSLNSSSDGQTSTLAQNLAENANCHFQANAHILTGLGKDRCRFLAGFWLGKKDFADNLSYIYKKELSFLAVFLLDLIFSVLCYSLLIHNWRREKEMNRRYFLALVILYATLSFLVLLPIVADIQLRYFVHTIIVSLVLLGLLVEYLAQKYRHAYVLIFIGTFSFFVLANIFSLWPVVKQYVVGNRNSSEAVVLGETETMADYMKNQSSAREDIYLMSSNQYDNFFKSLIYIGTKRDVSFVRRSRIDRVPTGNLLFYITSSSRSSLPDFINDRKVINYRNFGRVAVYQLQN